VTDYFVVPTAMLLFLYAKVCNTKMQVIIAETAWRQPRPHDHVRPRTRQLHGEWTRPVQCANERAVLERLDSTDLETDLSGTALFGDHRHLTLASHPDRKSCRRCEAMPTRHGSRGILKTF
jgi:hypothetical protein